MSETGKEIFDITQNILSGKKKNGRLLEVGVGNREKTKRFLEMGFDVYGCDIMLEPGIEINIKMSFADASKDRLPYKDSFFDIIVCTEVLEHLENYHHALREFGRVLKKGGQLIISTPNVTSLLQRLTFLFTGKFRKFPMPPDKFGHITPLPLYLLKDRIRCSGFSIERVFFVKNIIPLLRIKMPMSEFFSDGYFIYSIKNK